MQFRIVNKFKGYFIGNKNTGDVLNLAWPALLELILFQTIQVINMIMVGHLGPREVAAVGITNQPVFVALSVFVALNVGTTALVARAIGAGEPVRAREVSSQSLIITLFLSLAVSFTGLTFAYQAMKLMGAAPDVTALGAKYYQLINISLIFGNYTTCASAILRGSGDTKTPMYLNIVTNLIVLALNSVLIYGNLGFPRMGIYGSGISTIVARLVGAVIFTYVLLSGRGKVSLAKARWLKLDKEIVKSVLTIGLPSAGEQFLLQTGLMIFSRMITQLGTEAFAAHQIAANVMGFSFMPGQAFSMAASTLVGQNLGAGKPSQAEAATRETRRLGFLLSSFMGLIFFLFSTELAAIYTTDVLVITMSAAVLRIVALIQPMQASQLILAGGLRGAGDTKIPLYSTAFSIWVVRLTIAYLLVNVFKLGLEGAWISFGIDQFFRWWFITARFNTGRWKTVLSRTMTVCECES